MPSISVCGTGWGNHACYVIMPKCWNNFSFCRSANCASIRLYPSSRASCGVCNNTGIPSVPKRADRRVIIIDATARTSVPSISVCGTSGGNHACYVIMPKCRNNFSFCRSANCASIRLYPSSRASCGVCNNPGIPSVPKRIDRGIVVIIATARTSVPSISVCGTGWGNHACYVIMPKCRNNFSFCRSANCASIRLYPSSRASCGVCNNTGIPSMPQRIDRGIVVIIATARTSMPGVSVRGASGGNNATFVFVPKGRNCFTFNVSIVT